MVNNSIDTILFKKRLLERLPAIPKVVHEVWRLIDKGDASPSIISSVISKDMTLSAKVLRLVNSPFYGFPNRIASIKHAVVLLGLDAIRGLLISTVVFGDINDEIKDIWDHACDCATTSGIIARILGVKEVDEVTVAGLLHDMGKVVIKNYFSDLDSEIANLKNSFNLSDYEAEKKVLGISHDTINKWIVEKWHFPPILTEALIYHHDIFNSVNYPVFAAVVSLADILCHIYRLQSDKPAVIPSIDNKVCQLLNLNSQILEKILIEMDKSLYASKWDDR